MNPITIYSKELFKATHRLHNISLSEEENLALYGMCYTNDYHGHNYELLVKITGMADTSSDSFIDAKILKSLIRENITELLDQKNLNLDIEAFKLINPTKENIARFIYDILREKINQQFELKIFLYEKKRNYVEYSG